MNSFKDDKLIYLAGPRNEVRDSTIGRRANAACAAAAVDVVSRIQWEIVVYDMLRLEQESKETLKFHIAYYLHYY